MKQVLGILIWFAWSALLGAALRAYVLSGQDGSIKVTGICMGVLVLLLLIDSSIEEPKEY